MDERFFWLAFSAMPGIGPVKFAALLKRFGTARKAWKAGTKDLQEVIGEKTSEKLDRFRKEFSVEEHAKKLKQKDVQFLTLTDDQYPNLLKQIVNPPFVLYVRGDTGSLAGPAAHSSQGARASLSFGTERTARLENSPLASPASGSPRLLAVVGTRKITNYGREVTRMLVSELVANGFTIVSGLAIGIDSVAAEGAIENGGKTIAVLGSGVDLCYPSSNKSLYDRIINGSGFVVSEFPLGQPPSKGSFPSRNRIIAGLSLGVLVTEGAEDSGALITADYAFKNNRKVFAVPGPITSSLSKGPHKLLSKGARLVTSGEDIIKELGITSIKSTTSITGKKIKGETKEEEKILKILEAGEIHIDEIVRRSGLPTSEVGSLLSVMEMKGYVRDVGGGVFSLSV